MTVITGDLILVTDRPATVTEVWIRAGEIRTHDGGLVLEDRDREPVHQGWLEINVLPGPAILTLVSHGTVRKAIPIVVPDAPATSLEDAVNAAKLAQPSLKTWLEELAAAVLAGTKGPRGERGPEGKRGSDGATYYTWVKYADTATGMGMSDDPTGKFYMGIAPNRLTSTASSNPADYSWSLIKGEPGPTGTLDLIDESAQTTIDTVVIPAIEGARDEALGQVSGSVNDAIIGTGGDTVRSMVGMGEVDAEPGTAWAHTTEDGFRLPLGYAPDGTLDNYAVSAFLRDVTNTIEARNDHFTHVATSDDGKIIWAIDRTGAVDIPGLRDHGYSGAVGMRATSDGLYSHVATSDDGKIIWAIRTDGVVMIPRLQTAGSTGYEVWERDGEILPANVDTMNLTGWGSSSIEFMQAQMRGLATATGITYHNHGKGAEDGYQTAARLGSRPMLATVTGGIIPTSGPVTLSSSNVNPAAAMLAYTATINGVEGIIVPSATDFTFTRTTPGDPVPVEAGTPAIPVEGHRRRADMTILNLGKNMVGKRAGADEEIIELMDEAFHYLAPTKKRVLMMGHFANTGTPATGMYRDQINHVNDYLRDRYGRMFVDFAGFVTTGLIWDYLGVSPTAEDLAEQALGNIPPGATSDGAHLSVPGRQAFAEYLFDFMADLGWI